MLQLGCVVVVVVVIAVVAVVRSVRSNDTRRTGNLYRKIYFFLLRAQIMDGPNYWPCLPSVKNIIFGTGGLYRP